jgi:hypothetical protein
MRAAAIAFALALVSAACATAPPPKNPSPSPPIAERASVSPLRLSGDGPSAPPNLGPPGTVVEATYRVCLDDHGRVNFVAPAPGLAAVDELAMTALRRWSWFIVTSDERVCFMTPVRLSVPSASRMLRQASSGVHAQLAFGPPPRTPPWVASRYAGKIIAASYKVCIGDDGMIQTVRPIAGVRGADDALIATLRASRWDLVVGPLAQAPYCFAAPMRLDFTNATPGDLPSPMTPHPSMVPTIEPGVSVVIRIRAELKRHDVYVTSDSPEIDRSVQSSGGHLFARYLRCVNSDGTVASVDPILPLPGDDRPFVAPLRAKSEQFDGPAGVGYCHDVLMHLGHRPTR